MADSVNFIHSTREIAPWRARLRNCPETGQRATLHTRIGRIGEDGAAFLVGSQLQSKADTDGRLFLGINDVDVANNAGEFTATITVNP